MVHNIIHICINRRYLLDSSLKEDIEVVREVIKWIFSPFFEKKIIQKCYLKLPGVFELNFFSNRYSSKANMDNPYSGEAPYQNYGYFTEPRY